MSPMGQMAPRATCTEGPHVWLGPSSLPPTPPVAHQRCPAPDHLSWRWLAPDYGSLLFPAYLSLCLLPPQPPLDPPGSPAGSEPPQSRCWEQGRRRPQVAACSPKVSPSSPPHFGFPACDEFWGPCPSQCGMKHARGVPAHRRERGEDVSACSRSQGPMGNRFDSNMTQEESGQEGQLGPAPGIPPAPGPPRPSVRQQQWPSPRWHPCHRARGTSLPPWPSSLSPRPSPRGLLGSSPRHSHPSDWLRVRPVSPLTCQCLTGKDTGACATSLCSGRAGLVPACSWWVRK